jgi:uncharacterized repeat protein (TIGR03809 family)
MTHRADVALGRDIVARWCGLAEQRLEHLTELFETGRWRRYHSEFAFLENIREAKAAVETWRNLLRREASRDNSAIDVFSIASAKAELPRGEPLRHHVDRPQPQPAPAEPPRRDIAVAVEDVLIALETERVTSDDAPSAPDVDASAPALDLAVMQERYPLLRNAL